MHPGRRLPGTQVRDESEEMLDEIGEGDPPDQVMGQGRRPPVDPDAPPRDRNQADNTADWSRSR